MVTYNIRKAIGLDRRRNPGRIMDVLNGLEADVIVLQEADRRLGARPAALPFSMIAGHSDFTPAPVATSPVSLGSHGNAILVRRGLEIGPVRRIELPGLEPRGAVAVEIGGELQVVGVHLGLLRRYRRAQLATLAEALLDSDLPTAILGDFNEWSPNQGLEALAGGFTLHTPGRSYHAARPVAALDRIALSPGLTLRDAGVEQGKRARIASDHLPVWANVGIG